MPTLYGLNVTRPEGAKFAVCPSPGEFGEEAFGGFGDLKPYGGMLVTCVPWGIAHALPLVNGGYDVASLTI